MGLWRALRRGFRALLRPNEAAADVDDEVRQYLDEAAADLTSKGLSADEARRQTRVDYGDAIAIREQIQSSGWESMPEMLAADVRFAARRLRHSPGFTLPAAAILGLGIGASTAIFSTVYPILFAPLPYPDSDRVVAVLENDRTGLGSFAMFRALAAHPDVLAHVAVARPWQPALTGLDVPVRLEAQRVSAGYFSVLGVAPALGRDFTEADDAVNGPSVAIMSDRLWRDRFGGDPSILGRTVRLDDAPYTVVGVMPAGFDNVLAPDASVWRPLQYDPALPADGREWGHHLVTVARLASGMDLRTASGIVDQAGRTMINRYRPKSYDPRTRFSVNLLQRELVRGIRPLLLAISGAVALVLAIACANVINLLLARGVRRRGELALRAALGAERARLVREQLIESLLLAFSGGCAGVALAVICTRALVAVGPAARPRAGEFHVDVRALAFAIGLTAVVGVIAGAVPAITGAVAQPQHHLLDASARGGRRWGRLRPLHVIAEVSLALVLLVAAGLLLRSVHGLLSVPIGFDASNLLTFQVQASGRRSPEPAAAARLFQQTLDAVRRVPGVVDAAATNQLPLSGDRDEYGAAFPAEGGRPAQTFGVFRYAVSDGYFKATRIPIARGRAIDERDTAGAPRAVVISEALAAERFGSIDPIGHTLRIGPAGPFVIVGVAGDVRQVSLALTDADAVYISPAQWPFAEPVMSFVIRTHAAPSSYIADARRAVWSVDRDQPIVRVSTMDDLVRQSASQKRFALTVFEAFGAVSLLLAAVGIYSLLAAIVSASSRDIGIQAALGATRGRIVTGVIRQGLALTLLGIAAGLLAAMFLSRALVTLLFGISHLDPSTYTAVVAILLAVSVLASSLPAWWAARVDPSVTLRAE